MKTVGKKINLAFVLCGLNYGGAERFTLDLIKQLPTNIFNVHLLTIKGGGGLLNEFSSTNCRLRLFNKTSKLGLLTLARLLSYFKQNRIDIVHTQLFAGDTWGRLAAILAGTPVIISTEQNINLDEGRFKKLVKKILSLWTDNIIAISQAVADYQINVEKISAKKITVIYNGIDLNRFPYQTNYQLRQPTTLGIVGRLEPQKGHAVAFQAFMEIIKRYPKTKVLIVGHGSQKPTLKKLSARLKIETNIIWQEPQTDTSSIYNKLDLLLIPSLWEGVSITALEAQAAGLPIIASDTGGLREAVINGQTGYLVPRGDVQALTDKILEAMNNPEILEKIRSAGRLRAEKLFDIKNTAKQYERIYRQLYENSINQ